MSKYKPNPFIPLQFVLYTHLLARYDPERKLYLAVTDAIYRSVFEEAGEILLQDGVIRLMTFNPEQEVISQWIP